MKDKFHEKIKCLFPLIEGEERSIELEDGMIRRIVTFRRTRYSPNMFIKQFLEFPTKSGEYVLSECLTMIDFIIYDSRDESLFPFVVDSAEDWKDYTLIPSGKWSKMDDIVKRMDMIAVELI